MRTLVLGMLLAAGAVLPSMAMAGMTRQDRPQEAGEHHEHAGEGRPSGGGRQDQPRPAPRAAAPTAAAQTQQSPATPHVQAQAQGRVEARGNGAQGRGDAGARFNGGDPNRGGPQGFRQNGGQSNRGVDGDPNRGMPQPRYRGQGGPNGYAPQDYNRVPVAPYRGARDYQGQFRGSGGDWNRGWRGDGRYDWGGYRAQNRGAFHLPRYYAPRGWQYGYRRFSPGVLLSYQLFDRGFWIDDAYAYRLPQAFWPYQWVRYYNDALLVDVRTGYVVDAVYDIFW